MEVIQSLYAPGAEGLLSPLLPFMQENTVSEIMINKPGEVFVERRGVTTRYAMPQLDIPHLRRLFTLIANENGQILNVTNPLLSGNIHDGARIQLVIPPAARHYTFSMRRPSLLQRTLDDYRNSDFYTTTKAFDGYTDDIDEQDEREVELLALYNQGLWADFMELAIALKKNIVISGETGSGKTTYLNTCTASIGHEERILTLEDTFEMNIPHQNQVNLCASKRLTETSGGVTMQDLVQASLRLRPDRIIMGEIRGGEILDFVSACSTGHEGSITTIHARNPRIAFMRMTQLYKLNNVPSMRDTDITRELDSVIDIIVQLECKAGRIYESYVYYKRAHDVFPFNGIRSRGARAA